MIQKIDHIALGISRLVTQFRESTNLINYIKSLLIEADELEKVYFQLLNERSIDTAIGAQLDIIGDIVGQTRIFVDADSFKFFGFLGAVSADSFGNLNNAGVGSRFISLGEPTTGFRKLNDEEYRLFIRARIAKNNTSSTPEEIIAQIKFIFQAPIVLFMDGNTNYVVVIGKILTNNEKVILNSDIIPKTLGVKVTYLSDFNPTDYFGFLGMPGAKGFGAISDPNAGGIFSSLI